MKRTLRQFALVTVLAVTGTVLSVPSLVADTSHRGGHSMDDRNRDRGKDHDRDRNRDRDRDRQRGHDNDEHHRGRGGNGGHDGGNHR
jgi:hypothetical protein